MDERFGFQPHTTWSDCTTAGARALLRDVDASVHSLGVTRTYATRHGEGPLPTRDDRLRLERHNDDRGWQGPFRTGVLDLVLLRHAIRVSGGIDGLALTHLDRSETHVCHAYRTPDGHLVEDVDASVQFDGLSPVVEESKTSVVERIEQRVLLESRGMTANEKSWRSPGRRPSIAP